MKFSELTVLFWNEMDKIKNNAENINAARFVLIAYNNVLKKISDTYSENQIATDARINNLEITTHMKEKLIDFTKIKITKKIKEQDKINRIKKTLNDFLGIGDKKADELIAAGITKISQLKQKKYFDTLNIDTQMTLMHNIVRSINLEVVQKFANKLVNKKNDIVLVGSYRRNKPVVRDIDILFCTKEKNDIDIYIAYLKKTFNNKIWIYANGNNKISLILQPDIEDLKYKVDIFITQPENYYSTLLYATGSQFNNIKMRARAKRMGFLLNQNGIFKNGKKINKTSDDESKLFKLLDLPYLEPDKRY